MAVEHKIDINEVSKEELTRIPGISEETAQAIIDFRERRGRISNIGELADVEQIRSQEINALREWLTAGSEGEEEEEESEEEEGEEGEEGEEEEEW